MKRIVSLVMALCLMCMASLAFAAGNVTIAVRGRDDFDSYIESMFVWGDRLLMGAYDSLYAWSPEGGMVKVEGYEELGEQLSGTEEEPGLLELDEGQYAYLDSQVYVVEDHLYRMAAVTSEDEVQNLLVELLIAEDGALSLGEVIDLGDALAVDYGDGYTGTRYLSNPCAMGRTIYALSYGENGTEIVALNLDDATLEAMALDTDREIISIAPYTEDKLFLVATDYNVDPVETNLLVYDIAGEEITDLGALPRQGYNTPSAICYDEARSKVYYALGGSVWRMDVTDTGFGEPQEFGDMPLEVYSDTDAALMGDLYILSSYDGVVGRDVTLDKLPEQKLRVDNSVYAESVRQAYYPFTDAHPEYMVSIQSGSDSTNLVQNMMNRSADVDIYTLNAEDSAFDALIGRGFMAELGGSEKLVEYVSTMYPAVKDLVMREGELYAIPLSCYARGITLNKKLLIEKFGYTQEDMPTTWPQMFALLADLSNGRMEDVPEATLMDPGYIRDDARRGVFSMMLQDYFLWLDADEANLARGSEVLIACCEAFEAIDWDGFGMPEEYEDNEDGWYYEPENIILEDNTVGLSSFTYRSGGQATVMLTSGGEEAQLETSVVLAIAEGEKPNVGLNITLAFVNPFSEHREGAIEYLENVVGCVDTETRMALDPTRNDPVENKYYEENMKGITESIADIEKTIEETEDEEQREALSQNLADMKEWQEEYEQTGRYEISEEAIASYRAFGESFAVEKSTVWGTGAYEQVQQYLDGVMTAKQLAAELEKTLQMKRLEGN